MLDRVRLVQFLSCLGGFALKKTSVFDRALFRGCKTGNLKLVKASVEAGADVNAFKCVGPYNDGPFPDETQKRQVFITPLLIAASSAFDQEDSRNYEKVLHYLIMRPEINIQKVVKIVEKEFDPKNHLIDQQIVFKTLGEVLGSSYRNKGRTHRVPYRPDEYYPVSDETTAFLYKVLRIKHAHETALLKQQTFEQRQRN